jgi:hypothetical protein
MLRTGHILAIMSPSSPAAHFEYILLDHGERTIFTAAPLQPGDSITLATAAGEMLCERIVARIEFAERTGSTRQGVFAAFVRFEERAERVGGA